MGMWGGTWPSETHPTCHASGARNRGYRSTTPEGREWSVPGHGRIDLEAPPVDATREVPGGADADPAEELDGRGAPHAVVAEHDDLAIGIDGVGESLELAERDEARARDARDRVLPGLAHVEEGDFFPAPQPPRELARLDLGVIRVVGMRLALVRLRDVRGGARY
jgi:hypothetical protein